MTRVVVTSVAERPTHASAHAQEQAGKKAEKNKHELTARARNH